MNMTYKRSRAIAALAIVVTVAVCVAACGSSSSTSSSSPSSPAAAASASASAGGAGGAGNRATLVACLKQHGVTLPSRPPSGGGYGPPPGTTNGTTNSNGNGNGGNGNGGNGNGNGNGLGNSGVNNGYHNGATPGPAGGRFSNPKFQAAFKACGATAGFRGRGNVRPSSAAITKFASCVTQHGYTLPKANLTGKGPVYPVSIERNAKFQAASRSCQPLLRPAGAGGPPGAGAPPGA